MMSGEDTLTLLLTMSSLTLGFFLISLGCADDGGFGLGGGCGTMGMLKDLVM